MSEVTIEIKNLKKNYNNSEAVKNAIIYTETAVKKDLISKFSSALSEL